MNDSPCALGVCYGKFQEIRCTIGNADVYANGQVEIVMGKAILGLPREALAISSKVFWPTMSKQL